MCSPCVLGLAKCRMLAHKLRSCLLCQLCRRLHQRSRCRCLPSIARSGLHRHTCLCQCLLFQHMVYSLSNCPLRLSLSSFGMYNRFWLVFQVQQGCLQHQIARFDWLRRCQSYMSRCIAQAQVLPAMLWFGKLSRLCLRQMDSQVHCLYLPRCRSCNHLQVLLQSWQLDLKGTLHHCFCHLRSLHLCRLLFQG